MAVEGKKGGERERTENYGILINIETLFTNDKWQLFRIDQWLRESREDSNEAARGIRLVEFITRIGMRSALAATLNQYWIILLNRRL